MSRNWIPALVAIGVGVFSGYYTFQPLLKDLQMEKAGSQRLQLGEQTVAPNGAQTPTANTKEGSNPPVTPNTETTQGGNTK
ncbi:hypothetical protein BDV27DRAFT_160179 [Aspergillus caelatus]|uniref:Uncharacterized protein n=2 Tax=Aspergillus subgen. Circumdati TaxID=2720871 RepID=A0A5N6ZYK7_9EURO|nr:uncharacterized protein BDV27DRAFT_160179 [Aspergillus caelatus]KAE8362019.1 hypothetical protein BDV27DRAFT_160179 [Aspergillus caelatus]KAE8415915.1 hypothetical protein BDV36DRAFT_297563 [Aspergillus pseudocaelatus]